MVNEETIKNSICSYELPIENKNPPRIKPDQTEYDSLIRPGERVFCIFANKEAITLEKIVRPNCEFQKIYESTSKDSNLYIIEGIIEIEKNDLYLSNIKIWDVYQVAEE